MLILTNRSHPRRYYLQIKYLFSIKQTDHAVICENIYYVNTWAKCRRKLTWYAYELTVKCAKMSNTKIVYMNFPYILIPVPTLHDYSSFDLSVIYDLDLWLKILKIILHNEDSTSNMYVKFQINRIETVVCRARSGLRTEPQTDRQTDTQRQHYSLSVRLIT